MAKSQQGAGAITVWMIIFVALWLTSTVFLVILYTGQEELVSENQRLREDNARLISSQQRSSIPLVQQARAEGPTVVGLVEEARQRIAELATGEPTDDVATVRTKFEELSQLVTREGAMPDGGRFSPNSMLAGMRRLYESYKSAHNLRTAAEQRVAELEARVDELVAGNEAQKADFEQRAQQLAAQVEECETGRAAYRRERDEAYTSLERDYEQRLQQSDQVLTKVRQDQAQLQDEKRSLQERFAQFQQKFSDLMPGPQELATARKPDGQVLTAVPGDEVVYINLGREDRLVLGLQFTVYPAETGIPADGRGKARIEVVSIRDGSAECRKVWVDPRSVVLEGDLIANPVYDPDRAVTFAVVGQFDLDRDGRADRDGAAVIESLIEDWGGSLTSDLTALTDFVVLGGPPPKPRNVINPSAEEAERQKSLQEARDRYEQVVTTAESLQIPILPQEVFLNFLGFGNGRVALAR